jgi:hypothetical protein
MKENMGSMMGAGVQLGEEMLLYFNGIHSVLQMYTAQQLGVSPF